MGCRVNANYGRPSTTAQNALHTRPWPVHDTRRRHTTLDTTGHGGPATGIYCTQCTVHSTVLTSARRVLEAIGPLPTVSARVSREPRAAARGEGQLPPSLANLSSKNASSRPPTATPDAAADAPADAASRVRDPKLSTPAYLQSGVGMVGVRALLEKMRLEAYADAFDEAGYDDAEFVLALDGDTENGQLAQMMNDVGMKLGHKNKFFKFHKDIVATHNL